MLKTYKIIVSFGDGCPVHSTVEAKNGPLAQDLALAAHPGARSIRIVGIESVREEPKVQLQVVSVPEEKPHPLFTDITSEQVSTYVDADKKQKVQECLKLRSQGKSYKDIANILNVGKTTVGSWVKQYGPA
jgi:hypothetical protein